jgi:hypothetical protein
MTEDDILSVYRLGQSQMKNSVNNILLHTTLSTR